MPTLGENKKRLVCFNKQTKKKKSVWELLNPECNSPTRARIFSIFPPNASNYRNKTIYVSQKTKNEQKSLMWPRYLISLLGISKGRVRWMNHSQIRMVVLSRVSTHPIFIFHIVDLATTEVLIFWYLFLLLILHLLCADFCKASSVFKAVPFVRRLMFSTIFFYFNDWE